MLTLPVTALDADPGTELHFRGCDGGDEEVRKAQARLYLNHVSDEVRRLPAAFILGTRTRGNTCFHFSFKNRKVALGKCKPYLSLEVRAWMSRTTQEESW